MYKEVIISIVIIVVIFIANNISQSYTDKTIEEIDNGLHSLREKIFQIMDKQEEKNENQIRSEIEKILEQWEGKYYTLAIYIEHDELEKVKKDLVVLKANVEVKEYQDAITNLDSCIFSLKHIKDKEVLNLDNFF